jgi:hypothetical protein
MKLVEITLIFDSVECRDIQIFCIAAKSLVEPLEACRPSEGLKSIAPKHPEVLAGSSSTHPIEKPSFPT